MTTPWMKKYRDKIPPRTSTPMEFPKVVKIQPVYRSRGFNEEQIKAAHKNYLDSLKTVKSMADEYGIVRVKPAFNAEAFTSGTQARYGRD